MNWSEKWLTINLTTLALGVGRATASSDLAGIAVWFLPFSITVAGAALWQYTVSRFGLTENGVESTLPEQEKLGIPLHTNGKTTFLEEGPADKPFLLENCSTVIVAQKGGKTVKLPDVRAVTFAEFARTGWMVSYSANKMAGKILSDGFKTKVVRNGNWGTWTDALAQAGLVRKSRGVATVPMLSLQVTLDHILPTPLPKGWLGWAGNSTRAAKR